MPWERRRVKIGQLYGAGSLRHAARLVVGTKNSGRVVVFKVAAHPPCAPKRLVNTWVEGEIYELSKKEFFRWADRIEAEHQADVVDNTSDSDT